MVKFHCPEPASGYLNSVSRHHCTYVDVARFAIRVEQLEKKSEKMKNCPFLNPQRRRFMAVSQRNAEAEGAGLSRAPFPI
jgi:hypothetical protein